MKSAGKFRLILLTLSIVIPVLVVGTAVVFERSLKNTLWDQSASQLVLLNDRHANELGNRLNEAVNSIYEVKRELQKTSDRQNLQRLMAYFHTVDPSLSLYFPDGKVFPLTQCFDTQAESLLEPSARESGMIEVHDLPSGRSDIFDYYVRITLSNGQQALLIKEMDLKTVTGNLIRGEVDSGNVFCLLDGTGKVLLQGNTADGNLVAEDFFKAVFDDPVNKSARDEMLAAQTYSRAATAEVRLGEKKYFVALSPVGMGSSWFTASAIAMDNMVPQLTVLRVLLFLQLAAVVLFFILLYLCVKTLRRAGRHVLALSQSTKVLFDSSSEGMALIKAGVPYSCYELNTAGKILLGLSRKLSDKELAKTSLTRLIKDESLPELLASVVGDGKARQIALTILNKKFRVIFQRIRETDGSFRLLARFSSEKERNVNDAQNLPSPLIKALASTCSVIGTYDPSVDDFCTLYVNGTVVRQESSCSYGDIYAYFCSKIAMAQRHEFTEKFSPKNLEKFFNSSEQKLSVETQMLLSDRESHWFCLQMSKIREDDGSEKAAFVVRIIDKRANSERERIQATKDALSAAHVAAAAHTKLLSSMGEDIGNGLASIIAVSESVQVLPDLDPRLREALSSISGKSQNMKELISDVVDMDKLNGGRVVLEEEPCDIEELARNVALQYRVQAAALGIKVELDFRGSKAKKVVADEKRLRQVLSNLASNAIKYTKPGGWIKLSLFDLDDDREGMRRYVFICKDSGQGMSEEFAKHIFEPFARDKKEANHGFGLGLAVVASLLKLMGGSISVESEIGKGSTFTVDLPLVTE